MQFLTKGIRGAGGTLLRSQRLIETDTAAGTVLTTKSCMSTIRSPKPHKTDSDDSTSGSSNNNFKPVNLAYRALESRGKERDKQTKAPLIIQHSLFGRKENWIPVSEIINRTTQRKVITVDARNHGESPYTNAMSLPLMAKDILHLANQIKNASDKISFMGHSMGGRVGILLALMNPQILSKLVIVDSSVIVNDNTRRVWSSLRQACASLMNIEEQLKQARGYERLSLANKVVEKIIVDKRDRANFLSNLILSDKATNSNIESSIWRVNMSTFSSHPEDMMNFRTFEGATFEGSTLFINGDRSQVVSRDHETAICKVFPNAEFVWLKDCGHRPHIELEKDFCENVITFLEK